MYPDEVTQGAIRHLAEKMMSARILECFLKLDLPTQILGLRVLTSSPAYYQMAPALKDIERTLNIKE